MRRRPFYPEIFLVSLAVLLLQIAYTRIFSFKVSSYFTYLIIGFALLGIGSGGVFVALSARLRAIATERLIAALAPAGALVVASGYAVVAGLALDLTTDAAHPGQIARLALVCGVLYAGFVTMGVVVAAILARRPQNVSRLYAADLAGAGAGCAVAIPLLLVLTPPGCVFAAAAAFAAAGVCAALRERRRWPRAGAVAVLAALAALALTAEWLPDPVVDRGKTLGAEQVQRLGITRVFHRWSPVFRVDVLESPLWPHLKVLAHDGLWGSALWGVDPSDGGFARVDAGSQRLAFAVVRPQARVLVIGAAGGRELMASLHLGAAHVTGVELNPVSVSLLEEHFADYTGRVAHHERVRLVNAEGRSFLRSHPSRYDLVSFVAPDSYATMNAAQASGFVLAESHLYTVEAIQAALGRLAPGGVLAIHFGEVDPSLPVRTLRYLATARRALEGLGAREFARQVLVATTRQSSPLLHAFPISTILLGAAPFGAEEIDRFFAAADTVPVTTVDHAWGRAHARGAVGRLIGLPSERLARFYANYPYRIDPVFDDAPYFWHFVRFRELLTGARLSMPGDSLVAQGERALVAMLVLSMLFALVFLILPFAVVRGRFARLPHKSASVPYFAALGLGFMGFEVCMIQKLTLFLGYPTRALTVTLFALLLASGVGSWLSGRYVDRRDQVLLLLVSVVILLTAFHRVGLDALVEALGGAPLAARIAMAVTVIAPLGLALGAFLPLGLASVSRCSPADLRGEYVAWCWAVNGFFSVVGSLLVTMFSMSWGFRSVLFGAALLYVAAGLCLRAIPLEGLGDA